MQVEYTMATEAEIKLILADCKLTDCEKVLKILGIDKLPIGFYEGFTMSSIGLIRNQQLATGGENQPAFLGQYCKPGYALYNGFCYKQCPSGTVYADGICINENILHCN